MSCLTHFYQPSQLHASLLQIRTTETSFLITSQKCIAMKIYFTSIILLLFSLNAFTQSALSGKVTDADTGEPILFGDVLVYQDSILVTRTQTDFDGYYNISLDESGTYLVKFKYVGYTDVKIENIVIKKDVKTSLNAEVHAGVSLEKTFTMNIYRIPLIEENKASEEIDSFSSIKIRHMENITSYPYEIGVPIKNMQKEKDILNENF